MSRDELDQLLRNQDKIAPSSSFVHGVMRTVYREADAPKPIPFPWKRALPGLTAALFVLCLLCISPIRTYRTPEPVSGFAFAGFVESFVSGWVSGANGASRSGTTTIWVVIALLITFVSLMFPMRLFAEEG